MKMTEKVKYIHDQIFGGDTSKIFPYANNVQLTGFILNKPYEIEMPNGHWYYTFSIIVIKREGDFTFYQCETHAPKVQYILHNMTCATFISALGFVHKYDYDSIRIQVEEMERLYEFPDINVDESYSKKGRKYNE